MKILLSAYACEPGKGSEPGVGWNWAQVIAQRHELWVLTRRSNRAAIEAHDPAGSAPIHWVYYDWPAPLRFWKRGGRGLALYYYLWQLSIYPVARRLHRQIGFDIVHHVTFGNYWTPSLLAFLPTRFILGPVGGGESGPDWMMSSYSRRGRWHERLRDLIRWWADHDPLTRASIRRAHHVLATTEQTAERLGATRRGPITVHPQCGLTEQELASFGRYPPRTQGPFRLISIARLVHWKGLHLALPAFARLLRDAPDSEYWIIGVGPEMTALQAQVRALGLSEKVTFWGRLPALADVHEKLAAADVLVHPAVHEAFGNACLEALGAGKPVVCLDLGGPALQVTPEVGIKVPVKCLSQVQEDLAAAFLALQKDSAIRGRMAWAAQQHAATAFSWEAKAAFMNELYEAVVHHR